MHNLLSYCWHVRFHLQKYVELLTIDPHFPSSCFTAAQAAHFPGASTSTGLDSEVGLNGPRNCPFGEPSSDIRQLPPGKMARWEDSALTFLSVAGVATWQVSVDLKAHRTKQLDGLEQVCQCVWSP